MNFLQCAWSFCLFATATNLSLYYLLDLMCVETLCTVSLHKVPTCVYILCFLKYIKTIWWEQKLRLVNISKFTVQSSLALLSTHVAVHWVLYSLWHCLKLDPMLYRTTQLAKLMDQFMEFSYFEVKNYYCVHTKMCINCR